MSRRQRRALTSRLRVLVLHLLKWHYQPKRRSPSWQQTIIEQHQRIARLMQSTPTLRAQVSALLSECYLAARTATLAETGLPDVALPRICPWTLAQIFDVDFWPEGENCV